MVHIDWPWHWDKDLSEIRKGKLLKCRRSPGKMEHELTPLRRKPTHALGKQGQRGDNSAEQET